MSYEVLYKEIVLKKDQINLLIVRVLVRIKILTGCFKLEVSNVELKKATIV